MCCSVQYSSVQFGSDAILQADESFFLFLIFPCSQCCRRIKWGGSILPAVCGGLIFPTIICGGSIFDPEVKIYYYILTGSNENTDPNEKQHVLGV